MLISIHYEALEDLSGLTVSSEDSAFPKENLQDRSPENLYKPNTTAAVRIDMDFGAGSERAADSLILCNHDLFTQSSGIKLAWDAAAFPADDGYVIGSAGAYHAAVSGDESIWRETFTDPGAKRYWSLYVDACTAAFQLGTIFLGTVYEEDVFLPRIRRNQPNVAIDYTYGGTRLAVEKGEPKKYREYRTYSRSGTELTSMEAVAEAIGSMFRSIVLFVSDESLLMQAEVVDPFQSSLRRHEDNRWRLAFLELLQA